MNNQRGLQNPLGLPAARWALGPPPACSQVLALLAVQVVPALQAALQELPVLPAQGLHFSQQLPVLLFLSAPELCQQLAGPAAGRPEV